MALSDAKRFADALASDQKLLADVKPKVNGLAAFVEAGKQHGYNFSVDDAKQLVRSKVPAHQLSDQQLDAIGGGDSVAAYSNVGVATNTLTTAEGVSNSVGASEVAVVVAAVIF
jgi:predicted ribosomally synthesized peptide with nif11-like leader